MTVKERLAATYAAAVEDNHRAILAAVLPGGELLVDLGCGDGAFTRRVAERAGVDRVVGLEVEPRAIALARERGIDVIDADLGGRLPFDDGSVDIVHSNQVIEHLPDTDLFLREIRRVLRPSGYAIISTNNLASWHNIGSLVVGWQPLPCQVSDWVNVGNPMNYMEGYNGGRVRQHLRLFTGRALRELAEFHGLRAELDQTAGYYPFSSRWAALATRVDPRHGAYLVQRYRVAP